jgi:benzoate-CoA ligase family protein
MAQKGYVLPDNYLNIPERINITEQILDRNVREGKGGKVAIYYGDKALTYGELQKRVNKFGNALKKLGVAKGDRFVIRSHNTPDYLVAVLGGMKIGAIPIPTNTLFRSWELEHIINNSDSKVVFTMQDLASPIEEVKNKCPTMEKIVLFDEAQRDQILFSDLVTDTSDELEAVRTLAEDPAFMIYTSGTTNVPKGVSHVHRWLIGSGDPVSHIMLQLTEDDVTLFPHEMSFLFSFCCNFLFPFKFGASIVLWSGRFDVTKCMQCLEKNKVTIFLTVPTVLRMILNEKEIAKKYNLSSLRFCISGGEILPPDTYSEFNEEFDVEVFDIIGQSEAGIYLGNWRGLKVKPGSMGKPYENHIVSVVDDEGKPCPTGEIGHLVIDRKDPGLATEYRKMPELWSKCFKGDWFYTGDLAYIDEEGYYFYVSRSDDLIKSRAYLISPAEVESATMEHPAVLESGVVGVSDEVMGKRVKAFIVLKTGYEPSDALMEDITKTCKEIIAPFKVPKEIEFVSELPKTATGKIMRRKLRGES